MTMGSSKSTTEIVSLFSFVLYSPSPNNYKSNKKNILYHLHIIISLYV